MKDLQINSIEYVGVWQIIPEEWNSWVWDALTEDAPFSWGDNIHSLVDPRDFANHLEFVLSSDDVDYQSMSEYKEAVFDTLNYLCAKQILIDLES